VALETLVVHRLHRVRIELESPQVGEVEVRRIGFSGSVPRVGTEQFRLLPEAGYQRLFVVTADREDLLADAIQP